MKEIGGYLELENFKGREYYEDCISLNSARNALLYLLKARKIEKIYLPYFLCDSVSNLCEKENYEFEYYNIDANFIPIFEKSLSSREFIYIVNYYGQIDNVTALGMKEKYSNIILDNVQAFFQNPIEGIDTLYSCRKFFGVPDGAYLFSNVDKLDLETDISKDRMKHLLGRYEASSASDFYSDFKANDRSFVDMPLRYMSKLTHNLLSAIDYEQILTQRNKNWNILNTYLGEKNKLNLFASDGPYMYPFYCDNGMAVKKKLAENKIFVPTLWPNVLNMENCGLEKDYAENILPLPIDQRYGEEDMLLLIREVLACIN